MRVPVTAAVCVLLLTSAAGQRSPGESASGQRPGQKVTTASGNMVRVYSLTWPNPVSPVSADVEVCAGDKATFAFPSFFQIHFADGGAIGSYGSHKQPTFERRQLAPTQCVRGWLDFAVTTGQKPTSLHYHEPSSDQKPIDWQVK